MSADYRMPPFASGRIVGDYEPLYVYWRKLKDLGREDLLEKSTLSNRDFDYVRGLISSARRLDLETIMESLTLYFKERVDPDIAALAMSELGYSLSVEESKDRISRILAGWLVEACEHWKILRIREGYIG